MSLGICCFKIRRLWVGSGCKIELDDDGPSKLFLMSPQKFYKFFVSIIVIDVVKSVGFKNLGYLYLNEEVMGMGSPLGSSTKILVILVRNCRYFGVKRTIPDVS